MLVIVVVVFVLLALSIRLVRQYEQQGSAVLAAMVAESTALA
ncbi:hypothetical protein [Actinophytocola sp.]